MRMRCADSICSGLPRSRGFICPFSYVAMEDVQDHDRILARRCRRHDYCLQCSTLYKQKKNLLWIFESLTRRNNSPSVNVNLPSSSGFRWRVNAAVAESWDTKNVTFGYNFTFLNLVFLFLPPATKLWQGNVFTRVCDSVRGGGGLELHSPKLRAHLHLRSRVLKGEMDRFVISTTY